MTKTKWRMVGTKRVNGVVTFSEEQAASDVEACHRIHQQQIEKYGKDVVGDEPDLLKPPVWLALVAERDDVIVDYYYAELIPEGCMGGCDTRAAASLRQAAPGLIRRMQHKGFRFIRTVAPRVVEGPVGKELRKTGFRQQDAKEYAHFLLDLRKEKS